jgi:hypothetical protein
MTISKLAVAFNTMYRKALQLAKTAYRSLPNELEDGVQTS